MSHNLQIINADCLAALRGMAAGSVHCCVTSPPYWGLRDYGVAGQIGLEATPEEYVARMVGVFAEVWRVLRDDGTCWVNLGDSYASTGGHTDTNCADRRGEYRIGSRPEHASRAFRARAGKDCDPKRGVAANGQPHKLGAGAGLKAKDMVGIPWRVAFALQAAGWYLRSDIIWHKINPMPESVTDRPTKAHEYVFLLTKCARYFYDAEAVKEPVNGGAHPKKANGANSRMVTERAAGREDSKPNASRGHVPGVGPKTARAGSGIKANESYNAAVIEMVGSRNKRDVWPIASAPYSEAHFATFPPDLIKPCILAGTSARGCCPKCGAPWERIMEAAGRLKMAGGDSHDKILANGHGNGGNSMLRDGFVTQMKTVGWKPTCRCVRDRTPDCSVTVAQLDRIANQVIGDLYPVPCTVLDPFGGSGTTGQVALELGRRAVLIELNPKYIPLIQTRTNVTPGLALG